MISQKLQDLLKKLSQSIWTDENGNVEIGKNLEVDGEATINTKLTSVDNSFNRVTIPTLNAIRTPNNSGGYDAFGNTLDATYSKAKYHHCVTIQYAYADDEATSANFMICFVADSTKNTPIDSFQDLTSVFGGRRIPITGNGNVDASPIYIDLHSTTISGAYLKFWDSDIDEASFQIPFSKLTMITYKDDVSID